MPEYHLLMGSFEDGRTFASLDAFTQGYIEALFFTEECSGATIEEWRTPEFQERWQEGQEGGSFPGECSFADLAPESLETIIADCAKFQSDHAALLERAYILGYTLDQYDPAAAGRDYLFTRNGHGCGFWDRGLGKVGELLADACRHDEINVEFGDDDKIYVR